MKKLMFLVACVIALTACDNKSKTNPMMIQNDSLRAIIEARDNEINDMMGTLNDIQDGFRAINEAQGRVTVERRGEGANASARIRENMQFIQETMNQNKELINKLRIRLRDSNTASEQLRKTIENLTAQMEEKESEIAVLREELEAKDIHIAELDQQVSQLSDDVVMLKDENAQKDETIGTQDKELNTAWYVFGTKRELKEQNILKSGEVLQGNFNKNYFTKIDIRVDKEIKLMSRDAKLLTNHPAGSYTLERDANKQYVLRITNPQQFWSTSKYLVVQVK